MRLSPVWIARARFTLGVLAVWGAVSVISGLAAIFVQEDTATSKLERKQFCTVMDFMASDIFGPTPCYVYDRAYRMNRAQGGLAHLQIAEVDPDTLVMVEHDMAGPSVKKGENGRTDVDERLVTVNFISGPLSGRRGMIARYKLSILK